ncbi:hypothetical protein BGX24_007042 [Mortierella sp. AD032]|nr:hypothetical protein BGX24_007042 [Mortierella sp. AD032]
MRSHTVFLCLASAAVLGLAAALVASAADHVEGTEYQDDLSTIATTGSPEFYRDEILSQYHLAVFELYSHQQQQQQQQQQQHVMATAADDCANAPGVLVDGINAVENQLSQILSSLPFGAVVQYLLSSVFKAVLSVVDGPGKVVGTAITGVAINLSFAVLKGALSLLSLIKFLKPILTPVIDILSTTQTTVLNTDLVADAIAQNPVTKGLPEGSSEDLRRVAQGALDTLEWMEKYSVASNLNLSSYDSRSGDKSNDDAGVRLAAEFALTGRPFFAGKILHQYMVSLLEVATSSVGLGAEQQQQQHDDYEHDETVLYALTSLGLTINMSNALEACLSAATLN